MVSTVNSGVIQGIDGYIVHVEGNVMAGLPVFEIVGLPDTSVKESKERVRTAVGNCGFEFPLCRVTINLAPGNIRKEGPIYDFPIAMAILLASEQLKNIDISEYMFIGELSLDGRLRPVSGVLPIAIAALKNNIKKIILPIENAKEAAVVNGVEIYGATNLYDAINHLAGEALLPPEIVDIDSIFKASRLCQHDFADVKGQGNVKRALEIAAAGGHNCLMIGTPGSGKTMLAQRLPSILPDLSFDEALEVTKIHSIAGILPPNSSLVTSRPFRSPHHTVSTASLSGGGKMPRPGEVSLAHNGVLFLDELPEFGQQSLEVLRQPLEDGQVTISRVNATLTYPSRVMLIAAMNPCKCGYFGDTKRNCTCSTVQIQKYLAKISGPLLDRIDLHIEVNSVQYSELSSDKPAESSSLIRDRVNKARKTQLERYTNTGIFCNAQLSAAMITKFCHLGESEKNVLKKAFERLSLSARAWSRIIKVARTIADLEGAENISTLHLAEAIQYRTLDRKLWG